MALRIGNSFASVTRLTESTSFTPPGSVEPAPANELFSDGFGDVARAPVNLGASQADQLAPPSSLPSFRIGAGGLFSAPSFASEETRASDETEAASEAEGKNPYEVAGERLEELEAGLDQLNGLREDGASFAEAKEGALESLDNTIDEYSRVEPNLTGDRQAYAQSVIEDATANRDFIEGNEGTFGEQLGQLLEDIPGANKVGEFLESSKGQALGAGLGAVNAGFEGVNLYEDGDSLGSAAAGAAGDFALGTVPGTQGIAAFDTLSKLGVELTSNGVEAATGLGSPEASEAIYGRGVFTDTAVDGARALENLGEAAVTGDTSGLDNFRDSVDNGSLFERVLGTVGNAIGATAAAIETGSTQPFSDFADDTSRAFSTLGEKPSPASETPSADELSNPFSNQETPAPNSGEIPSYELNGPETGFGPEYGEDFNTGDLGASDFGGGGGGGGMYGVRPTDSVE